MFAPSSNMLLKFGRPIPNHFWVLLRVFNALSLNVYLQLNSSTYAQRLTNLKLQSLEHRRIISDLVMTFNIIHGFTVLNFDDFFSFSTNLSSRGHPFKLNIPLFTNNNYKKHFFSSRIVQIWNALPINLVMAGCTQSFKRLIISHNLDKFLTFPTFYP